jgi:F-type H+-transporting ATPase subunit a
MLPFNLIGDISRSIALAVRLYGNVMSGATIGAILITLVPLFFPIIMQVLGLVTGVIQAWIFAILATVYIASASELQERRHTTSTLLSDNKPHNTPTGNNHG